jgi:hypothetical protein
LPLTEEEFANKLHVQIYCDVHVYFSAKYIEGCSKGELYELQIKVANNLRNKTINQYKLEFNFPDLSVLPIGYVQYNLQTAGNVLIRKENGFYQVIYNSRAPLLSGDNCDVGKEICFRYCCRPNLRGSDQLAITWNLHTDDGFSLKGDTNILNLWLSSQQITSQHTV